MSVNRKRNPYTLGNFALQDLPKRRASCTSIRETVDLHDPFEHDPFKVQSYNFRYADPPGFPLETPFCAQPLLNRNTEMPQPNFRESRRRRFVQSSNYNPLHGNYYQNLSSSSSSGNYSSTGYSSSSNYYPNSYGYLNAARSSTNNAYGNFCSAPLSPYGNDITNGFNYNNNATPSASTKTPARGTTPTRHMLLKDKRSTTSLCEIQIRINRSQHTFAPDNVVINIATDKNGTVNAPTYKKEGLTINSRPYNSATVGPQTSKQTFTCARALSRRPSNQSLDRGRCYTTSSDSSSDLETPQKKSLERMPQFIALKTLNDKVKEEKQTCARYKAREQVKNSIPFVTPPWVLGAKSPKELQKNTLHKCKSNQTIMDNLDTQDNMSKMHMNRKSSMVSLTLTAPVNSQQNLKRSNTSLSNNSTVKMNSSKPRSSSALRNSRTPEKSPLRVNINLFRDKTSGLRV